MDNIPTGILKFVYFVLCLFTLICMGLFGYHWESMSTYLASSQEVISNYGGVTSNAQRDLSDFSKKDYDDIFTVEPNDNNAQQVNNYGDPIHYTLRADIPLIVDNTVNHVEGVHHLILTKRIGVTTYSNVGKDDGDD